MFNSTHTLVGLALARAGGGRGTPWAPLAAALAANLPDIDIVTALYGPAFYLAHHRVESHSLPGILVLSLGLAALLYGLQHGWAGRRGPGARRAHFGPLLRLVLISMLTHPLLDYTNFYGIPLLWPLSRRWYAADIIHIVNPYMDVGLGLCLWWSYRQPSRRRAWAAGGLIFVMAFWALCAVSHREAERRLAASTVYGEPPVSAEAFPTAWNPFTWAAVFETRAARHRVYISAWGTPGDLRPLVTAFKPAEDAVMERARTAYAARVFLDFARFPVAKVESLPQGYRVTWVDFRTYDPATRTGFAAWVTLSPDLRILSDDFSYRRRVDF